MSTLLSGYGLEFHRKVHGYKILMSLVFSGMFSMSGIAAVPIHEFEVNSDFATAGCVSVAITNDGADTFLSANCSASSADPQVSISNLDLSGREFDLSIYDMVEIRMKTGAAVTGGAVIYWGTTDNSFYSSERMQAFTTTNDNNWHTYVCSMADNTSWSGLLSKLRIDPMSGSANSGKSFSIDYIRLRSDGGEYSDVDPVVLNMLWRVKVGSGGWDRMTTIARSERTNYVSEGQVFYVPQFSGSDRHVLNRFCNSATYDHRDYTTASLTGYSTAAPIGYPWTSQFPGTDLILQFNKQLVGKVDWATGYAGEDFTGYTHSFLPVDLFGYSRYGLQTNQSPGDLLSITGGGVTYKSSRVAGGAIFEVWWNGEQFINNFDYGRQMQSALFFTNINDTVDGICNPTEAGAGAGAAGGWAAWENDIEARQGSPILHAFNIGGTQITQCVPLDFLPEQVGGGVGHPVIYSGLQLGKELTPDFRGLGTVAKYVTVLHSPEAINGGRHIEIPTVYLRKKFNHFFKYNADANVCSEVTVNVDGESVEYNTIAHGGVIAADGSSDTSNALGIYGVHVGSGGSVTGYKIFNFAWPQFDDDQYSPATTKLSAINNADISEGDNRFATYIVVGTLETVTNKMHTLCQLGVK